MGAELGEGEVEAQVVACREEPLGLLDDDPAAQGLLQLLVDGVALVYGAPVQQPGRGRGRQQQRGLAVGLEARLGLPAEAWDCIHRAHAEPELLAVAEGGGLDAVRGWLTARGLAWTDPHRESGVV